MSLAIPLSKHGGPLSRQIYLWLRRAALLGTVGPGERLPSTRDLAEQLSVSRTVILLAYDQLLAEGFLTGRAGSGTYVSEIMSGARGVISESPARVRLSRFGQCAVGAESEVDFPGRVPRSFRYDFSYRRSAVEGFPFEAWRRILMRRARSAPPRSFDYGPPAGSPALCDAISAHLRRSRAVVCDGSQIIIVNGSQQALDLAARVLLERGDRVAIEDPQYQGAREIFRAAGALLRPIPVDREGLDAAKLPKRARIAFVTPSHQFPTGAILPLSRRLALLEWAKRADAMIIEDDYDGEFRYEGQPVESLQGLDTEGRVIYVGTFSRTIFPALRLGYLVVPKSLVSAFTAAKWLCDRHTATLDQETLAEFIGSGAYHRHLRRARHENTMRRDVLLDAIHRYLRNRVALTGEGAGAHVVLWTRGRETEEATISSAASLGVGIYGISRYFLTRSSRVGLMLGYSSMKEEDIRQGIRQLGRVIH